MHRIHWNDISHELRLSFYDTNRLNIFLVEKLSQENAFFSLDPGDSMIINLEGINFIDSAAFSFIVMLANESKSKGTVLRIINLSEEVLDLIQSIDLPHNISLESLLEKEKELV